MALNYTEQQAQELRDDPDTKRTDKCPLCDPEGTVVESGISVAHVCRGCDNVWQPAQVFGGFSTCILSGDSDGG